MNEDGGGSSERLQSADFVATMLCRLVERAAPRWAVHLPGAVGVLNGEVMGELIVLGILIGIGTWLYRAGKRTGSRKGYNVGRSRRR